MFERCPMCETESELIEAISEAEIVKICVNCANQNHFPIIQKPTREQLDGTILKHKFPKQSLVPKEKSKVDKDLERMIVASVKAGTYKDLVDNFHWQIQHARRKKKMSPKQLAEAIAEPVVIVEMAEKSKLPNDYTRLISKLEQFLGVQLFKEKPNMAGNFDSTKIGSSNAQSSNLNSEGIEVSDEAKPKKGFWKRFFSLGGSSENGESDKEVEKED